MARTGRLRGLTSMPRRNAELLLLLAVTPIVLLVFALVRGAIRADLGAADFLVPGGLLAAFAVAHLAARRFAPGADPALLPIAALLSGIGLAIITRLDAANAGPGLASSQVLWLLAGVLALVATLVAVPSLERLGRFKYTIMLLGLVLLLLPAVVGREINGARLWLRFGGLSFQPAEIAKILDRAVPGRISGGEPRGPVGLDPEDPGSVAPVRAPAGTPSGDVGGLARRPGGREGSGKQPALLRHIPGDGAGGDRKAGLRDRRGPAVRRGGGGRLLRVRARARTHRDLDRPLRGPPGQGLSARCSRCSRSPPAE